MPTSSPADAATPLPAGAVARTVERVHGERRERVRDALAAEAPVALLFNGIAHVVMMATPCDLEDLARGFALSEGIVAAVAEIGAVTVTERLSGFEVALAVPAARAAALPAGGRALEARSGCGLCGVRTLEDAIRQPPSVGAGPRIEETALHRALAAIGAQQAINRVSGATHAAGWARADGELVCVREDVGRHNALDKLIGALAVRGFDPAAGFLLLTSRASYEMVVKAAMAGITVLAAMSAPTALAVSLAQSAGLTLIAFARRDGHVIYTRPERLVAGGVPA